MSQHTNLVIFVGAIPAEIGQLTELSYLSLEDNSLTGKSFVLKIYGKSH